MFQLFLGKEKFESVRRDFVPHSGDKYLAILIIWADCLTRTVSLSFVGLA